MQIEAKYLRRQAAADYLKAQYGVGARRTLDKLASIGGGPRFVKIGGAACYSPADLDAWMQSRLVEKSATHVVVSVS
jgi:predicted DNA-binding transcriptional regulator AlpA